MEKHSAYFEGKVEKLKIEEEPYLKRISWYILYSILYIIALSIIILPCFIIRKISETKDRRRCLR